jgi:hypothetical protein
MAYGPPDNALDAIHLSTLDSIATDEENRRLPGPVTEYAYPRGAWDLRTLAGTGGEAAWFREGDAEAAQALVDREFVVLKRYAASPLWKEAWKRFYRAIYRDSFDRLKNAAFILERFWAAERFAAAETAPATAAVTAETALPAPALPRGASLDSRPAEARAFAEKALSWTQRFAYERNLLGSDFVNLVSAAQEGRGDCDSRAALWAILLEQTGVRAAIMVSRDYSHAMGLADLEGDGARFPFSEGAEQYRWLVAETTAPVGIGMIGEKVSEVSKWLAVVFD